MFLCSWMYILLLPILSYDIWFFISHLLLHSNLLYKYHCIHHSVDPYTMTYVDTYTGHWIEDVLQSAGFLFPYAFYNYTVLDTAIILFFLNARGMLRHDIRMTWLIGNHHILHHKHVNYNFGEYWIDCLCGTLYIEDA